MITRLGINAGDLILEIGEDSDCDQELRNEIFATSGNQPVGDDDGLSVGVGGGWSNTSWSNNGSGNIGGASGNFNRNGSVTNSYVNGGIGFNAYNNNGGGYGGGGWGGNGGGVYGGNTIIVVPYSPFTNTWGNPCYTPQVYSPRGCWSPQGQAWIR